MLTCTRACLHGSVHVCNQNVRMHRAQTCLLFSFMFREVMTEAGFYTSHLHPLDQMYHLVSLVTVAQVLLLCYRLSNGPQVPPECSPALVTIMHSVASGMTLCSFHTPRGFCTSSLFVDRKKTKTVVVWKESVTIAHQHNSSLTEYKNSNLALKSFLKQQKFK